MKIIDTSISRRTLLLAQEPGEEPLHVAARMENRRIFRFDITGLRIVQETSTRTNTTTYKVEFIITKGSAHTANLGYHEWPIDGYHSWPAPLPPEWEQFINTHIEPFVYGEDVSAPTDPLAIGWRALSHIN